MIKYLWQELIRLSFPWMIPRIITAKPSFSLKIMEKNICLSKMIERGKPRTLIFDVENRSVFKTVPLYEEGPNGIPAIFGSWPVDMNHFIVTTYSTCFYLVDDI